jgi:hypothetical protein
MKTTYLLVLVCSFVNLYGQNDQSITKNKLTKKEYILNDSLMKLGLNNPKSLEGRCTPDTTSSNRFVVIDGVVLNTKQSSIYFQKSYIKNIHINYFSYYIKLFMVRFFGINSLMVQYSTDFNYILDSEIIYSKSILRKIKSDDIKDIYIKLDYYEHFTNGKKHKNGNGTVIIKTNQSAIH